MYSGISEEGVPLMARYIHSGKTYSRADLKDLLERESRSLDPDNWRGGQFEFDDFLTESVEAGTIGKVDDDEDL